MTLNWLLIEVMLIMMRMIIIMVDYDDNSVSFVNEVVKLLFI